MRFWLEFEFACLGMVIGGWLIKKRQTVLLTT